MLTKENVVNALKQVNDPAAPSKYRRFEYGA